MSSSEPQFLDVPRFNSTDVDGPRRIAYIAAPGVNAAKPGLIWLQGFKSEMVSTKATYLAGWTRERGIGFTRFDYSGHGQSGGRFEDGTISQWLEEARAVFEGLTSGPQILIGSSMGGFLALLLARALRLERPDHVPRIAAIVLIAPAWDMTEALMWPRLPEEAKAAILRDGVWHRPSKYGDGPYPITRALIEDGRRHRLEGAGFDPACPVRIIHGVEDTDVPYQHSLGLLDQLRGHDIHLTLVKDGEHRLSRPQDLALLTAAIEALL